MREWLVIESSMKNAVFADPELRDKKGYIPRDAAEKLLGRSLDGTQWFTREDDKKMRGHPEWRDTEPENTMTEPTSPSAQTMDGRTDSCPHCAAKDAEIVDCYRQIREMGVQIDGLEAQINRYREAVDLILEHDPSARAALQPKAGDGGER
jgi:hypothetical protein